MHAPHVRRLPHLPLPGLMLRVAALFLICIGFSGALLGGSKAFAAPLHQARAMTQRSGLDTIIFVHGFLGWSSKGDSTGSITLDCNSFSPIVDYLGRGHDVSGRNLSWARQDFRELKFYTGDKNCGRRLGSWAPPDPKPNNMSSEDLHNPLYTAHCNSYYPEGTNANQDGTNMESLYHVSCLLNWYLHLNFQDGWNVEIVAHSMGGLIVRNAIYQVQKRMATWTMPATLPNISDVVTFGTPHGGEYGADQICSLCTQGKDIVPGNYFMNEMFNSAQNPQWGGTDWTMIGSYYDVVVDPTSAMWMSGGRKSYFTSDSCPACYDHGGYLNDEADYYDATIKWCDGCVYNPSIWNSWNAAPRSLHHMFYALWLSTW
jgi:hypothetical protein